MSTDGPVRVHVVLPGGDEVRAGTLRFHERRRTASATFTYEQAYLADPRAYALDPTLQLDAGSHQSPPGVAVFGAMSDGAPDRWGRNLMTRAERERAQREGVTARTLIESDFLLGTRDDLRQGALRYTTDGETFLAPPGGGVPRLIRCLGVETLSFRAGRKPCLVWSFLVCDVVLDDAERCTTTRSSEV